MTEIIMLLLGLALGFIICFLYKKSVRNKDFYERDLLLENAAKEAENTLECAKNQLHKQELELKEKFDEDCQKKREEFEEKYQQCAQREKQLESKVDLLQARGEKLDDKFEEISRLFEVLVAEKEKIAQQKEIVNLELEKISGVSPQQARTELIDNLKLRLADEQAEIIRGFNDKAREKMNKEAMQIMFETMQRYASECAYDRTSSTVYLPSDEIKGRIIGRDGRNIRTIEALTGANVLIDDTPETVVVSCFEPYRRRVAKQTLEVLIEDGRIHPNRIHEVVNRVRDGLEQESIEAAEFLVSELNVGDVPLAIMKLLGKLKFRFTLAQNQLQQSKEVAAFMGMLAAELNLNVTMAKRCGLLHVVGKALDEHAEGSYAKIGAEILARNGEENQIVKAVERQNDDLDPVTDEPMAHLLSIAKKLSENRPGARQETMEFYIRRLHQMEQIAKTFNGISSCRALQAGRELIVSVDSNEINENASFVLAKEIAAKLDSEMSFPGPVQVTVIRESKSTATIE